MPLSEVRLTILKRKLWLLIALSWSPSHSLTLRRRLGPCAPSSRPLEWMMQPCVSARLSPICSDSADLTLGEGGGVGGSNCVSQGRCRGKMTTRTRSEEVKHSRRWKRSCLARGQTVCFFFLLEMNLLFIRSCQGHFNVNNVRFFF